MAPAPIISTERLANLGYYALGVETNLGAAVTPSVYIPGYKDTFETQLNLDELAQIVGVKAARYQAVMGMRSHEGVVTFQAEPNTAEYLFDMLMHQGTITPGTPNIHPFTVAPTELSKSYTMDILKGEVVHRYFGVMAQSIDIAFNKNEMRFDVDMSALGSFIVREIAAVATKKLTLKQDYDPNPTLGLVSDDLIRIMKPDGSDHLDTVVDAVDVNGVDVTMDDSCASFAAGDLVFIRAATPTYTILPPFKWSQTQFCFGVDAATALAATQTRLEQGSKWKIVHTFEKKAGADRSGAFDPANLVRTTIETQLTAKKFFDFPTDLNRFLAVGSNACVVRHYVVDPSTGTTYELRVTLNRLVQKTTKRPLEVGKIIYNEIDFEAYYNASDGQVIDVEVLNNLAS
jgi:hypothetical protein